MDVMSTPLPTVDLAELASHLRIGVTRLARRLRSEADVSLTPTLLSAIATIDRHGPLTAGALAAHEQVRKPTATRLIRALSAKDLVERTADPLDGRMVWLALSPEGRRVLDRARRRKDEFLARRIKRLSHEDQTTLTRAVGILERLIEVDR
jgi:DNA-binding MarR family transcriptional regulator